ncbi:MAG: hypothetical protein J7642_22085 [Cyanobacteria bacterium SBC]|nr:hypothetical protein [Cyanobacteria bacterium SBC]
MTAQISDRIIYNHRKFYIAIANGHGLFNPADHNIHPVSLSTACYRGFHCTYTIIDDSLYLHEVCLGLNKKNAKLAKLCQGPLLFGQLPTQQEIQKKNYNFMLSEWKYQWPPSSDSIDRLMASIEFTGGLLIADDFIREMYVHIGFHSIYKYRTVCELIFERGHLVKAIDCTSKIAELHQIIEDREKCLNLRKSQKEALDFLNQCFTLDYKIKYINISL